MAKCKDCIHGEICDMFAHTRTLICTDRADKMCKMFKPKSEFVEILDKLDRFINSHCIEIKDKRGRKGYVTSGVHFAIAEFKKKYTEEKS